MKHLKLPTRFLLTVGQSLVLLATTHVAWASDSLVLNVNPITGQAAFRNDAPFPIPIDGYAIHSASGSLAPAIWNSLEDQNISGWEQAPPAPTATAVAELQAIGSTTFPAQTGFSLGALFKTGVATQDLHFEYLLPGSETPSVGEVTYGFFEPPSPPVIGPPSPPPAPGDESGDVNGDGIADINDYIIIRNNFLGTNKTLATGDLSGDGVVNSVDFRRWKNSRLLDGDADGDGDVDLDDFDILTANYNMSTGGGAFDGDFNNDGFVNFDDFVIQAQNMGVGGPDEAIGELPGVPEPAGVMVLLLGAACFIGIRRR